MKLICKWTFSYDHFRTTTLTIETNLNLFHYRWACGVISTYWISFIVARSQQKKSRIAFLIRTISFEIFTVFTLLVGCPPFWHRKQMVMLRNIMEGKYSFTSPEWADISGWYWPPHFTPWCTVDCCLNLCLLCLFSNLQRTPKISFENV